MSEYTPTDESVSKTTLWQSVTLWRILTMLFLLATIIVVVLMITSSSSPKRAIWATSSKPNWVGNASLRGFVQTAGYGTNPGIDDATFVALRDRVSNGTNNLYSLLAGYMQDLDIMDMKFSRNPGENTVLHGNTYPLTEADLAKMTIPSTGEAPYPLWLLYPYNAPGGYHFVMYINNPTTKVPMYDQYQFQITKDQCTNSGGLYVDPIALNTPYESPSRCVLKVRQVDDQPRAIALSMTTPTGVSCPPNTTIVATPLPIQTGNQVYYLCQFT